MLSILSNRVPFLVLIIFFCFSLSGLSAAVIDKQEPNNNISTAQNIDNDFSLDFSADIGDWTTNTSEIYPHVTINAQGNGTEDYYSFTASANDLVILDIDYGLNATDLGEPREGNMDTVLYLWGSDGITELAVNDDALTSYGQRGSQDIGPHPSSLDSYLQYTFSAGGLYFIQVRQWNEDFSEIIAPQVGSTYTLQVSVTPIPEPKTYLLMGAFLALGIWFHRRQRRSRLQSG